MKIFDEYDMHTLCLQKKKKKKESATDGPTPLFVKSLKTQFGSPISKGQKRQQTGSISFGLWRH